MFNKYIFLKAILSFDAVYVSISVLKSQKTNTLN